MSEQPTSPAWTDADDRDLTLLLIKSAYGLAVASEIAERDAMTRAHVAEARAESMARHPSGRAMYVPLVAPPLPNYRHFGHAIRAYVAVLLIVAGFLVGVTQHPWVAIPLVWAGCALGVRLAIVHYRTGEKP